MRGLSEFQSPFAEATALNSRGFRLKYIKGGRWRVRCDTDIMKRSPGSKVLSPGCE